MAEKPAVAGIRRSIFHYISSTSASHCQPAPPPRGLFASAPPLPSITEFERRVNLSIKTLNLFNHRTELARGCLRRNFINRPDAIRAGRTSRTVQIAIRAQDRRRIRLIAIHIGSAGRNPRKGMENRHCTRTGDGKSSAGIVLPAKRAGPIK
jgi:hypothetical protein